MSAPAVASSMDLISLSSCWMYMMWEVVLSAIAAVPFEVAGRVLSREKKILSKDNGEELFLKDSTLPKFGTCRKNRRILLWFALHLQAHPRLLGQLRVDQK